MTGIRLPGLVIQERDRQLLKELAAMRLIDREQTKVIAGFSSTTRANTRLLALTRAGVLRRFFFGTIPGGRKAIYSLSPKGATLADAPYRGLERRPGVLLAGDLFVQHQLDINSVYLIVRHRPIPIPGVRFSSWQSFPTPLSQSASIIPDGYFELESPKGVRAMFLEVDRGTETLKTWKRKTEAYLRLAISHEFGNRFSRERFRVLVVTASERRLITIRATVCNFTDKVFWFGTLEDINQDRFWSPIWLRPNGNEKLSLL